MADPWMTLWRLQQVVQQINSLGIANSESGLCADLHCGEVDSINPTSISHFSIGEMSILDHFNFIF